MLSLPNVLMIIHYQCRKKINTVYAFYAMLIAYTTTYSVIW